MEPIQIAIDGPAASGKSSVARLLAARLGFLYVNTGGMYRAVTWLALRRGISASDGPALVEAISSGGIFFDPGASEVLMKADGEDAAAFLNSAEVNAAVSVVAAAPEVRRILVAMQQRFAEHQDVVMEGRDICTVVLPRTPFKFYIHASEEVRQQRRAAQGLHDSISKRDALDQTRATAPLDGAAAVEAGAHWIDSTALSLEGVIGEIVGRMKDRGLVIDLGRWTVTRRPE
jgi:cytidylate kinase